MTEPARNKRKKQRKSDPVGATAPEQGRPRDAVASDDPSSGSSEAERISMNCRRVLFMLQELHRKGYERLRIAPGISPSGIYWRCSIVPVARIRRDNGAIEACDYTKSAFYGSGQYERFFDWPDAEQDSPLALADKFLNRFPELAAEGKGADPDYVRWYDDMLRSTAPRGVPYATADWTLPLDRIPVVGDQGFGDDWVPLPPPGEYSDPSD